MNVPYGRIRVTREPALMLEEILRNELDALWAIHGTLPNPSTDSLATLRRIRVVERLLRVTTGTILEKGWSDGGADVAGQPQLQQRAAG